MDIKYKNINNLHINSCYQDISKAYVILNMWPEINGELVFDDKDNIMISNGNCYVSIPEILWKNRHNLTIEKKTVEFRINTCSCSSNKQEDINNFHEEMEI